jgi:hypothetical protein
MVSELAAAGGKPPQMPISLMPGQGRDAALRPIDTNNVNLSAGKLFLPEIQLGLRGAMIE